MQAVLAHTMVQCNPSQKRTGKMTKDKETP